VTQQGEREKGKARPCGLRTSRPAAQNPRRASKSTSRPRPPPPELGPRQSPPLSREPEPPTASGVGLIHTFGKHFFTREAFPSLPPLFHLSPADVFPFFFWRMATRWRRRWRRTVEWVRAAVPIGWWFLKPSDRPAACCWATAAACFGVRAGWRCAAGMEARRSHEAASLCRSACGDEPLAILPLSFVGFASMPSDPQIIDTDGPTSHRHGMA
jgi:hypothetical protein